ncbi:MAG: right-handed parallel beta-helix repeat-containing protein [Thermoplasmata archaeon]|nr:MAG: right-handed parallel beta-helix repeat-containing protein [Thermoplasmata archaeon]
MNIKLVSNTILFLLIFSGFIGFEGASEESSSNASSRSTTYIHHESIRIWSNEVFTPENGVTGGSGTQKDPYVIEGWRIECTDTCGISIQNTDAYFIIHDVEIFSTLESRVGIGFYNVTNGQISNSFILNNSFAGIILDSSLNITIKNNEFIGNGIRIEGIQICHYNTHNIINNTVNGNDLYYYKNHNDTFIDGVDAGQIILANCTNIIIRNMQINNTDMAIDISYSENITVENNNISSTNWTWVGINLYYSHNNTIKGNKISENISSGIRLSYSSNSNLIGNIFSNNYIGIELYFSLNNIIKDNHFFEGGISLWGYQPEHYCSQIITTDNLVNKKPVYYYKNSKDVKIDGIPVGQLILANCSNFEMKNLEIEYVHMGISIAYSMNIILKENNFINNYFGIQLYSASNNSISNNTFTNNRHSIDLRSAKNNSIKDNIIISNYGVGIYIRSSSGNIIDNNEIINNRNKGIIITRSSYNTIIGNTISNSNKSGIELSNSRENKFLNNIISSNKLFGIYVKESSSNNFSGNHIQNNTNDGIYLNRSSSNNVIKGNNLSSNNNNGIHFRALSNNNIEENIIRDNKVAGIYFEISSNNNIKNNNISNNNFGILLNWSSNNQIVINDIYKNNMGVFIESSPENNIYHNNFIENEIQAHEEEVSNRWYDEYPSGGNYWSDYKGSDIYSGPLQDQEGADGIGDTPYFINDKYQDKYPLMALYVYKTPETIDEEEEEEDKKLIPVEVWEASIIILIIVIVVIWFLYSKKKKKSLKKEES